MLVRKYMKSFVSLALILAFFFLSLASLARADESCQSIYGGGQTCATGNISVDKKILNPQTKKLVDSLNINDPKFQPATTINFQITVTNTSKDEIKRVIVKDIFPQFITFSKGPGKFDTKTKTLSFEVNNLKSKESRSFEVVAIVVRANELPVDQGNMCLTNQTTATENDKDISKDNSTFCIQKELQTTQTTKGGIPILPAPATHSTPATGGELLPIISLIPIAIVGFFLRKMAIDKL